jgi:uncharacterized membrane protein
MKNHMKAFFPICHEKFPCFFRRQIVDALPGSDWIISIGVDVALAVVVGGGGGCDGGGGGGGGGGVIGSAS